MILNRLPTLRIRFRKYSDLCKNHSHCFCPERRIEDQGRTLEPLPSRLRCLNERGTMRQIRHDEVGMLNEKGSNLVRLGEQKFPCEGIFPAAFIFWRLKWRFFVVCIKDICSSM